MVCGDDVAEQQVRERRSLDILKEKQSYLQVKCDEKWKVVVRICSETVKSDEVKETFAYTNLSRLLQNKVKYLWLRNSVKRLIHQKQHARFNIHNFCRHSVNSLSVPLRHRYTNIIQHFNNDICTTKYIQCIVHNTANMIWAGTHISEDQLIGRSRIFLEGVTLGTRASEASEH